MPIGRLSNPAAFALMAFCLPVTGSAEQAKSERLQVQFGVLLDNGDPIAGSVTCTIGESCRLLEQRDLDLRLKLDWEGGYLVKELRLRCLDECAFSNETTTVKFRDEKEFDFYRKGGFGIPTLLVIRPRQKLGRIMLTVRGEGRSIPVPPRQESHL